MGCALFGMGSALGAGGKSHGALRFLSGWDSREASSLLLLTPHMSQLLISSPFMLPVALETVAELNPVFVPIGDWPKMVADFFGEKTPAWIGVDEMPAAAYEGLREGIKSGVDGSPYLDALRVQKDEYALSRHREGAAICHQLFKILPQLIEIGKPVKLVQAELEYEAKSRGADYMNSWLTIRPAADRPRYWPQENQAPVADNSQILLGLALTIEGHWAHGIRMGYLGALDPRHEAFHQTVLAALDVGAAELQVGNSVASSMSAMEERLQKCGYDKMYGPSRGFRYGHGLGLSYEDPMLTDHFPQKFGQATANAVNGEDVSLKSGMLFELHPNLFFDGVGGAAIGDMVLVTDHGPERLTNFPRGLMKIGK